MVSVEVTVVVVVAMVEEVLMEEDVRIRTAVMRMAIAVTMRVPENKRRCLNHTALGNTRWTHTTLSKNRS